MKQKISLYSMSLLYVLAGINHFWHPAFYLDIMPDYMPFPLFLVYLSGACEIAFGALLLFERTRKAAAWLIVAMLIVFFTVHVDMIIKAYPAMGLSFWIAVIRIPLQFVLIRWAYGLRNVRMTS